MLTATIDIAKLIQSTTVQVHSIRDQIRKHIHLERSEIKEKWLELEMRAVDIEELRGDSQAKLVELYALRGAWLGLHSRMARQTYGKAMSGARVMELTAPLAL